MASLNHTGVVQPNQVVLFEWLSMYVLVIVLCLLLLFIANLILASSYTTWLVTHHNQTEDDE